MSMTKRYLERLPEEEQNEILGISPEARLAEENGIDPDYEAAWADCLYDEPGLRLELAAEEEAYHQAVHANTRLINAGDGSDDYPDYGDLPF